MNATMARKKTEKQVPDAPIRQKPGRKPSGLIQSRESFNLVQELQDALVAYVNDFNQDHEEAKTDKTTVMTAALRAWLRERGYWPWPRVVSENKKDQEE